MGLGCQGMTLPQRDVIGVHCNKTGALIPNTVISPLIALKTMENSISITDLFSQ